MGDPVAIVVVLDSIDDSLGGCVRVSTDDSVERAPLRPANRMTLEASGVAEQALEERAQARWALLRSRAAGLASAQHPFGDTAATFSDADDPGRSAFDL